LFVILLNYTCVNKKTNPTLLTTTTPFKTKQKRFPKEAKKPNKQQQELLFLLLGDDSKQKSQQEQEAGCPQLRAQPKNINLKKWMLYNPAMLRKMEFVDIARQKFSPFFAIFLPKWQKLSYFFGLILLLQLMPPSPFH